MLASVPISILRFARGVNLPRRAYLDTNLLLLARDERSYKYREASTCLGELLVQGVELCVSPLVLDELWWILFHVSHKYATGHELDAQEYKRNADIWRDGWPRIHQITDDILRWNRMSIVGTASPKALVSEAVALMDVNPLSPRDAFHLAVALHNGIPSLVTADADFDKAQLPAGKTLTLVRF